MKPVFANHKSVVTGRETFVCTFEKSESCLLTNDHTSNNEMWNTVDGRGAVADNTLRSGL